MEFLFVPVLGVIALVITQVGWLVATDSKSSPARNSGRAIFLFGAGLLSLLALGVYRFVINETLFIAAAEGRIDDVKAMLAIGASPDASFEDGTTAIDAAKRRKSEEIVKLLRNAGAREWRYDDE
jgi:hypothetical protein